MHRPNEIILQPPAMVHRDFVRELSPETLEEFERIRTRYRVTAGEVLFTRGEPANRLYELASGSAKLWVDGPKQEICLLRLARSGELLGLREVVTGSNYGLNATAATPVEFFAIPRKAFLELLHEHFDAGFSAARMLSNELNFAHETLRAMVAAPAASKERRVRVEV